MTKVKFSEPYITGGKLGKLLWLMRVSSQAVERQRQWDTLGPGINGDYL